MYRFKHTPSFLISKHYCTYLRPPEKLGEDISNTVSSNLDKEATLRLPPLPALRDLVKLYKLRAIKQLSQNFLMDPRLTDKIVKMAGKIQGGHVVEVGPGPGGLTRSIITRQPKKLTVIEKDKRFSPTLAMLADAFQMVGGETEIILNDILSTDMSKMFADEFKRDWLEPCPNIHLIGNLPFSVATHLIIRWLQNISEQSGAWANGRVRMTLTFQKEVAERLVAEPGDEQRCRLSVMAQAWTTPSLRFVIPGKAFVPKPDVDVGVVTFRPLLTPRTKIDFALFEKVNRHIFSFRQKYSYRGAGTLFPEESREDLSLMMYKLADIERTVRPFQLTVEEMNRLCEAYKYLLEKHPELETYNYRASRKILPDAAIKNLQISECA